MAAASAVAAAAAAAGRYAAKVLSLLIYVDSLSWIFAARLLARSPT